MSEKECRSCVDYDDGLCDRTGFVVEQDDTCEKHRDCNGCFGAAGNDCQRCQESREKIEKEETTVGYKTEELAKAVQVLLSCTKRSVEEDIELVRRNPSLSFLQKLRIIRNMK